MLTYFFKYLTAAEKSKKFLFFENFFITKFIFVNK